jgi:hypothetical protein
VDEFGEGMQAKLEHDFRPVCLYGPDGNSQLRSNLLIQFAQGQKTYNFNLAGGGASLEMLI